MSWWAVAAVAPLAVVLVIVCLREPLRVALPVYTALIPFGGALSVGSSPFGSASSLMGLLLGAGLVAQFATNRRFAPRLSVTVPIWTFFLSLAAASALWTIDWGTTATGLAVLTSLVVVFLLVTVSHADRTIVRRTETALLTGSAGAVGYGLFQIAFEGGLPDETGTIGAAGGRFGDVLLGPNILAVTLLVPMAIAFNRAFNPRDPGRPAPHVLVALLMLVGILMTGSRTGVAGAAVVALVLLWAMPRGSSRWLVAALLVGAAATVFVWTVHPFGLADRTFASATSSSGRIDIWRVGLAACADYCGHGSGWGTFPDVYAATQPTVPGARVLTGPQGSYQPHNLWLLAVIELGVVGVVLLALGLGASAYYAAKLPPEYRPAALGAVTGLAVGVIFLSSMEFKIFWFVLTLVSLYRNVVLAEEADARSGSVAEGARS
jgi:O-antigen ligase